MLPRTFEFDDYPRDGIRLLSLLDFLKSRYPKFKACVFCIPVEMTDAAWSELLRRSEWLKAYPHGFKHVKGECRRSKKKARHLKTLDAIARDARWGSVFKPPWYGYCGEFFAELHTRGFSLATKSLQHLPFPMPAEWRTWNVRDAEWATSRDARKRDAGRHVVCHPVYNDARANKAKRTEISSKHVARWSHDWTPDDEWAFVDALVRPVTVKLHLACGPDAVWQGWDSFDAREFPGVQQWRWGESLPFGDNRADVAFCSHSFNYIDESEYATAALEVWRVLRPGAIWRLSEDATDSGYVWRSPGQRARGTGTIRSLPTRAKLVAALRRVGFTVHDAEPGNTRSVHSDVLQGDSRDRRYRAGHKFYLEACKSIDIPDLSRSRFYDPRARRTGVYRLPDEAEQSR
jgi:hypothetical protein